MRYLTIMAVWLSMALLLGACGGSSGSTPAYKVGGTVSGLEGSGLTLQNNGGDDMVITANGPFVFPAPLFNGANYVVTVLAQPNTPTQTCSISNGSGSVAGADVADISVECGDRYESNNTCPAPLLLTTLNEKSTESYLIMTIYPAGDQDWYRVKALAAISDPTACFLHPKQFTFTVTMIPPTGEDYDLQVCYLDNPDQTAPCPASGSHIKTSNNASDEMDTVSVTWGEDCSALDDRYFSVRVYPFEGAASSTPYSLVLSFQSQ